MVASASDTIASIAGPLEYIGGAILAVLIVQVIVWALGGDNENDDDEEREYDE